MDTAKEGYFGLPEVLFNAILTFLQKTASGAPGPQVAAALGVLVSLAQAEHAAAASIVQVRPIDAVFRALEVKAKFDKLDGLSGSALATQLAFLKTELDDLTKFWGK